MTQRASDMLAEVADRLSEDATQSGVVAAEAITAIEPELLKGYKGGSLDELVTMSTNFLRALFRSLRPDSNLPWPEYYTQAREYARGYAGTGVPLESLIESGGGRLGARGSAPQAGEDDRHAARRGGGVLRDRSLGPEPGGRNLIGAGGISRRPDHGRVERDPGRAPDEGCFARSDDGSHAIAAHLRAQRPGVRRRGRRSDRGRARPRAPAHQGGPHRLSHRSSQSA